MFHHAAMARRAPFDGPDQHAFTIPSESTKSIASEFPDENGQGMDHTHKGETEWGQLRTC
jgi:hypothetical protein